MVTSSSVLHEMGVLMAACKPIQCLICHKTSPQCGVNLVETALKEQRNLLNVESPAGKAG
jgi:hypothetical protein